MNVENIIFKWQQATNTVLEIKELKKDEFKTLLEETYSLLSGYKNDSLVSKNVCKLFIEIESFIYFASLIEDKENKQDFYFLKQTIEITDNIKKEFFNTKTANTLELIRQI